MSQNNVKYNQSGWPLPDSENRPRTIGERALQTEPNAHHGNVEVVGEHQRSIHRQLCLQTRSPLPSSTPPKRTTRVTRTDTATLTPTRRRFQQLRKTKAQDKPEMDPDLEPEVQPEQPSTPAELIDAVPTEWATTRGLVKPRAHFTENNPAHQPNSSMPFRQSGPQHAYPSERRNTGRPLIQTRS